MFISVHPVNILKDNLYISNIMVARICRMNGDSVGLTLYYVCNTTHFLCQNKQAFAQKQWLDRLSLSDIRSPGSDSQPSFPASPSGTRTLGAIYFYIENLVLWDRRTAMRESEADVAALEFCVQNHKFQAPNFLPC